MRSVLASTVTSAALMLTAAVAPAHAAPVRDCGAGLGGSYRNLTTRAVSCAAARRVAVQITNASACWPSELRLGRCSFRRGSWRVSGRWFRDRQGLRQLDLRATAFGGRVVRLQTDWDGE